MPGKKIKGNINNIKFKWSASKLVIFFLILGLTSSYMSFKGGRPLGLKRAVHTFILKHINMFFKMSFK